MNEETNRQTDKQTGQDWTDRQEVQSCPVCLSNPVLSVCLSVCLFVSSFIRSLLLLTEIMLSF